MPSYSRYSGDFRQAAEEAGLTVSPLGSVFGRDILFASTGVSPERASVLVLSGFHGEEDAAPLGILRCLQSEGVDRLVQRLNLGIVPVANPEGFDLGKRYNRLEEKSNQATYADGEEPSTEGRVLLRNLGKLAAYADHYLDMHEDIGARGFYIYCYGVTMWHRGLWSIGKSYFTLQPDGRIVDIPDPRGETRGEDDPNVIRDGIVDPYPDGSFDEVFSGLARFAAVTETPASAPEDVRVSCNADLLRRTLEHASLSSTRVASRWLRCQTGFRCTS